MKDHTEVLMLTSIVILLAILTYSVTLIITQEPESLEQPEIIEPPIQPSTNTTIGNTTIPAPPTPMTFTGFNDWRTIEQESNNVTIFSTKEHSIQTNNISLSLELNPEYKITVTFNSDNNINSYYKWTNTIIKNESNYTEIYSTQSIGDRESLSRWNGLNSHYSSNQISSNQNITFTLSPYMNTITFGDKTREFAPITNPITNIQIEYKDSQDTIINSTLMVF